MSYSLRWKFLSAPCKKTSDTECVQFFPVSPTTQKISCAAIKNFSYFSPLCCAARPVVQLAFICSPPARPVVQPAGTYLCAARRSALVCSPPVRIYVQPAGTYFCAARRPALLCSPLFSAALRRALSCGPPARPLVHPVGSLSCADRPNVQLAGPPVLARFLVQPAENSCFSIGNTALQPARPAGPPFSVIR